ncbi:integral membrane protein GPR137 isoform X3 [Diceros bicornis minor]|uniref:integral membrane protein GPR137 isoform X3 n=1 Tax=Diceros bicornis minor TaxID=77932 RepID=UPI0026ED6E93|nr:integral membrane protein GPR137 isoform X3 [Diceros bicornis minor]
MESNLSGPVPAAGLVPALPPAVTLGLTAAYTTLYALLFFSVYAQLWLVLLYGHKRLSYQTVFLALCLLWAALRTTLFSFYFRDTPRANRLGPLPFWLLYCCPVCLQFFTLTLMNLYFAQADLVNDLGNKGYLVFGLILFVWELLPTTLLVGFFRVHRPPQDLSTSRILNGQVFGSRSYFFDRAGHCEDEGCSWEHSRGESTRCWDQAATTTVSTPPHRRDPLLFPPRTPRPQSSYPRPLCQVHLPLLAQDPGGCGCLFPWPAACYSCCSELMPSPRMGGMALVARCPQRLGMTCCLRFYTGASDLSCTCHSINSVCAPRPFTVCRLSAVCSLLRHLFS